MKRRNESKLQVYDITPEPKPRMTRADRWKKRPCIMKYWEFKSKIRELGVKLPQDGFRATFVLPIPQSASKAKRLKLQGKPHKNRPDLDNMVKSLLDSVLSEDSGVWNVHAKKVWGEVGKIIIEPLTTQLPVSP